MIIAFIGCSGVGKSTIMNLLYEIRGYKFIQNVVTRNTRSNEFHKLTISEDEFDKLNTEGDLMFYNDFYNKKYGFLANEIRTASADLNKYYMMDFGIQNISQLDPVENLLKIIVVPESKHTFFERVRTNRYERHIEITKEYEECYSELVEGYNKELNAYVLVNQENKLGTVVHKLLHLLDNRHQFSNRAVLSTKKDRIQLIFKNLMFYPLARNGLEAFKYLTECINDFEDNIWGKETYNMPRTFLDGKQSERLYTILPESFYSVDGYSGVTLLLSRNELIFISKSGAIEGQFKMLNDSFGNELHFSERYKQKFFEKLDFDGDSVWHIKNL